MIDGRFVRTTAAAAVAYLGFAGLAMFVQQPSGAGEPAERAGAGVHAAAPGTTVDVGGVDVGGVDVGWVERCAVLRLGDESEVIGAMQQALRDRGFSPGPVDGRLGDQTLQAVSDYVAAEFPHTDGSVREALAGGRIPDGLLATLSVRC